MGEIEAVVELAPLDPALAIGVDGDVAPSRRLADRQRRAGDAEDAAADVVRAIGILVQVRDRAVDRPQRGGGAGHHRDATLSAADGSIRSSTSRPSTSR